MNEYVTFIPVCSEVNTHALNSHETLKRTLMTDAIWNVKRKTYTYRTAISANNQEPCFTFTSRKLLALAPLFSCLHLKKAGL